MAKKSISGYVSGLFLILRGGYVGLLKKVKKLFSFYGLYKKIKEAFMTKGMRSSEFWVTVIASLVTVFESIKGNLDPQIATIIGAVLTAVYTIGRSLVKSKTGETDK